MKGILEGCVLGIILRGETYGYEILSELEKYGFENLVEGTLYPILTRLNKKGFVSCRKAKSPLGPVRNSGTADNIFLFYKTNDKGKRCKDTCIQGM